MCETQARDLQYYFSGRTSGWSRLVQREKQIARGFPDDSSEHQASKENGPPGRTRHLREAEEEEGGGQTSPDEALPRDSCAAERASTFG